MMIVMSRRRRCPHRSLIVIDDSSKNTIAKETLVRRTPHPVIVVYEEYKRTLI